MSWTKPTSGSTTTNPVKSMHDDHIDFVLTNILKQCPKAGALQGSARNPIVRIGGLHQNPAKVSLAFDVSPARLYLHIYGNQSVALMISDARRGRKPRSAVAPQFLVLPHFS